MRKKNIFQRIFPFDSYKSKIYSQKFGKIKNNVDHQNKIYCVSHNKMIDNQIKFSLF